MQSVVSFTIHKHVRGIGDITASDEGQWRRLLRDSSPCDVSEILFEPIADSGNRMKRCTVTFDGEMDVSKAQRMARKTGLVYVEFSDFHMEVPAAVGI